MGSSFQVTLNDCSLSSGMVLDPISSCTPCNLIVGMKKVMMMMISKSKKKWLRYDYYSKFTLNN